MRFVSFVSLAVSLVFAANPALAQKRPKPNKKTDGPSAAATWTDPTDKEKSDKGPYTPHKEESGEPAPEPKNTRTPDKGRKREKLQVFGQIDRSHASSTQLAYDAVTSDELHRR